MTRNFWVMGAIALLVQGCASPFSKFYQDQTGDVEITTSPNVVLSKEEPKLVRGTNQEEDALNMREAGYLVVGYSSFNAGNVDIQDAIDQAKDVHASVVIVYSEYTHTQSRVISMRSGSVPYHVRRGDYVATYWIKLKKSAIIFGINLQDLTTELRQELGSNKGVLIRAVLKGSPAFQADVLRGDVLRRIGDIEIYDLETYHAALEKYKGQAVSVEIYRNGKKIEKKIKLNTRS